MEKIENQPTANPPAVISTFILFYSRKNGGKVHRKNIKNYAEKVLTYA